MGENICNKYVWRNTCKNYVHDPATQKKEEKIPVEYEQRTSRYIFQKKAHEWMLKIITLQADTNHVKTKMRYWFREWLKLKILTKINVSGNMELEVSYISSENVNGRIWENVLAVSYQVKLQRHKNISTQKLVYNIHGKFSPNSQTLEITWISIKVILILKIMTYLYNGVLLSADYMQ